MTLSKRRKRQRILAPRRKRMTRQARLASAASTQWVARYGGKNLVRGYARWFGVDQLSAVIELRKLGVTISPELEKRVRQQIVAAAAARARRREASGHHQREIHDSDSDDTFAHIAGFTPAGFPYGVTWEELDEELPWPADDDVPDRLE